MNLAMFVLGVIGNITSMFLFLSPTPTFLRILKTRDTGEYSSVPYVCTLLNCLLWLLYGAVKSLTLVLTINGAGLILEFMYLVIFLVLATRKPKLSCFYMILGISSFYAIVVLVVALAVPKDTQGEVVGSICVIIGTLMYASPLAVMKLVIKSRSVQYMPFLLSFASFGNGCLWTAYGAFAKDVFIILPNGLGTVLGGVQLLLYGYYKTYGVQSNTLDEAAPDDPTHCTIDFDEKKIVISSIDLQTERAMSPPRDSAATPIC